MTFNISDYPLSVQERLDAKVVVKVPATPNRKAYEYTKNIGAPSQKKRGMGIGQKAAVGAGILGLGAAAIALAAKGRSEKNKQVQLAKEQVNSISGMAGRIGFKGRSEDQKQKDAEAADKMGSRFADALRAERDIYYSKEKKPVSQKPRGAREKSADPSDEDAGEILDKIFSSDRESKFKTKPAPEPKKKSRSVATTIDQSGKEESGKDYKPVFKSANPK